jgi:hypothetical protein
MISENQRNPQTADPSDANALNLAKYSIGVGDRFARQARAQLRACMLALDEGIDVIPVWNKSNREHGIVGSSPESVRDAAEEAVRSLGWTKPFHIDADHINLGNVDKFLNSSDFFTIDVAEVIGKRSDHSEVAAFVDRHPELTSGIQLAGGSERSSLTRLEVEAAASKYYAAIKEAARIYQHIAEAKAPQSFITEVSLDETDTPQTPGELRVILAAFAEVRIPLQTIAPKFTGRFNKGVDYVGDVAQFEKEFHDNLAVISWCVEQYQMRPGLKLSVHSGSDKFSIYPAIRKALSETHAGLHLKTAGTTWLEELIGMAETGGEGLDLAKEVYAQALLHREELCAPYASVIEIDASRLPSETVVRSWSAEQYVSALRHDPASADYNPNFRQLLHVGYKIAAKMGSRYLRMLEECEGSISRNVTHNLHDRHIVPIFPPARRI